MKKTSFKHAENFTDYFPLGLAKDKYFCNRVKEQELLKRYIELVSHTVLVSPRRYGKSSLAIKTMENAKLPYEIIDLFVARNAQTIEQYIVEGIQRLISKIMTAPKQMIKLLKTTLSHLDAKLVVGTNGLNLEFSRSSTDTAGNILEALQTLDTILIKNKKSAILFIDEFQQIGALAACRGIEGALRHVAQETQHIIFIFSGSNRHLLTHMFHDSNRPFYKLCHEIKLQRIEAEDYTKYLNHVSQKSWGENLPHEVLTEIFNCTERHPYYINALCMKIWMYAQKPTPELVRQIWEEYVFEERSKTINELNDLTANQYFILNKIAYGHNTQLTSHVFLNEAKIPSASVIQALAYLEKNDYIYKKESSYYLVDPLIKSSLLIFAKDTAAN